VRERRERGERERRKERKRRRGREKEGEGEKEGQRARGVTVVSLKSAKAIRRPCAKEAISLGTLISTRAGQ